MTEDEKMHVIWAMGLLEQATSNSLDPATRERWNLNRDVVIRELKELVR